MENQLLITLSRNKLLKNAEISKIDVRAIRGQLITIGEGEILYREGDIADIIYLVTSGEINILKKRLLGKTKSFIFGENDFFGHEEFFEETSRTSTAVALRDSYLIALSREEIETLIRQDDEILINLREPVAEIDEESLLEKDVSSDGEHEGKSSTLTSEIKWAPAFEPDKNLMEKLPPAVNSGRPNSDNTAADSSEEEAKTVSVPPEEIISHREPITESRKEVEFDESAFLNEDGIPKAENELPDEPESESSEDTKSDEDLSDVLFNIRSGHTKEILEESGIKNKPSKMEEDESFFQSFALTEDVKPIDQYLPPESPSKEEKPVIDSEPEIDLPPHEEANYVVSPDEPIAGYDNISKSEMTEPADKAELMDRGPVLAVNSNINEDAMNTDQLQMIIKAAELVNSDIRVDEVLKNIIDVATDLTHADRGTLYLVDKEKHELWSLITLGDEMREIRLKIGEGLAGFVAKSGETINIKDVSQDSRFKADYDKESGYTTKNMICFPVKNNKGEIIGVLQLINSLNGEFSKRDEEFLAALSIHSAIALNNAELVEKLLQGERVQSLGKMANFLIQDIKKPILVGKRYAEHLKSKSLPPDAVQVLDMLLEQLSQVAELVQTTSSYSEGKSVLRVLNVSLNNTLADYASRIQQYIESRHCELLADYDKDVTVKLDAKEFYQTYMHIIKNACDAMPEGGKIFISTKRLDKKVEIRYKDNGLGVPDGLKEKIFEPFMSYGKKEGTGLGLAITKKIIESHNGTLAVQSSLGEGATFIVTLPIASTF